MHEPDYSDLPAKQYDWASVYGEVSELLPDDAPEPLGKPVTLMHYVDANLFHDALTGQSVTGVLHMMNATPIDWFSKRVILTPHKKSITIKVITRIHCGQ